MKDNSLLKLGGACAILLGIAKIFSSGIYLTLPPDLRADVPASKFLPMFAQNSLFLMIFFWIETLVGVLGLAVVPALSSRVKSVNEGWARWTSNLASAGFVISAVGYTLNIARLRPIANAYVAGDTATRAALAATWKAGIDLYGLWGYGAVGFWILIVSLLTLRSNNIPRLLSFLGIVHALLFLVYPIGAIFRLSSLLLWIAGAGVIVAPIWWIGVGMILRRSSN